MAYVIGLVDVAELNRIKAAGYRVEPYIGELVSHVPPGATPISVFLSCDVQDLLSFDEAESAEKGPLHVWVDGGAKPNPGRGYGSFRVETTSGDLVHEEKRFPLGENVTNNRAEYMSLYRALAWLLNHPRNVVIHMDTSLVIYQLNGNWHVGDELSDVYQSTRKLLVALRMMKTVELVKISGDEMKGVLGH